MCRYLGILPVGASILLAGCESMPGPSTGAPAAPSLPSGYTCCNLHYENDWISDANWSAMPMIPAGASIKVVDYGRQQPVEAWAGKLVVSADPRARIAAMPPPVRDAIRAGKVALAMSKDEVIVALGYPPTHATPSLDSLQWKYWHSGVGSFLVVWDNAGRVKDVSADPQTRFGVVHETR